MIRALIFDFDGLIVETETPALQSWQEIFREYGQELTPERWEENVGRGERIDIVGLLERLTGRSLDSEVTHRPSGGPVTSRWSKPSPYSRESCNASRMPTAWAFGWRWHPALHGNGWRATSSASASFTTSMQFVAAMTPM